MLFSTELGNKRKDIDGTNSIQLDIKPSGSVEPHTQKQLFDRVIRPLEVELIEHSNADQVGAELLNLKRLPFVVEVGRERMSRLLRRLHFTKSCDLRQGHMASAVVELEQGRRAAIEVHQHSS
jgi:hypothetical protein